jgi:hypothetical protein
MGEDSEAAHNPEGVEVLTLQTAFEKRPAEKLKICRRMLELDSTNRIALA